MKRFCKRLTAILLAAATVICSGQFSGTALETGSEGISQLQQYLLGNSTTGGMDCNGDGVVDGMDLALLRQKTAQADEIQDGYTGFIRTNGTLIQDAVGKVYSIQGMAFGNDVWSNPSQPTMDASFMEKSYQDLAEMGFHSVRFYLNYGLFESDSNPYVYQESGFEWLDQNIAWAKENGIRLVLNMHYPQGGYQSQGNGTALWTEPENQQRLESLWTEIARRYADEPVILGYGLVNEPVVAAESGTQALALWKTLAQSLTDNIRTVDQNHMIFVERMCAAQDPETGEEQWQNMNDENNYVILEDDNVVYEFHDYDPHAFTHQGFDWAGTEGNDVSYPDESYFVSVGNAVWDSATFSGAQADVTKSGWQYLESGRITPKSDGTQLICLVFQAENVGAYGFARADDLKLNEYDETGAYVQTIYLESFDTGNPLSFWSSNDTGTLIYDRSSGYDASGCLLISGTTGDASGSTRYFLPEAGHSYEASGYFQVVGGNANTVVRPRVDLWNADSVETLNRSYLEQSVAMNVAFSEKYNVPIYCGEFGAGVHCFENDRGGKQWVSDILDIFEENGIGMNYHAYCDGSFGLYSSAAAQAAGERNEILYELFCEKLAE